MWVAGDETATIERLTAVKDAAGRLLGYDDHGTVDLAELPAAPEDEAVIEGPARRSRPTQNTRRPPPRRRPRIRPAMASPWTGAIS